MGQHPRRRRSKQRNPEKRDKSHVRCKSRGKLTCFYCGKPEQIQKGCRHLKKDKCVSSNVKSKTITEEKDISVMATSEEELLFICEQTCANLTNEECTWVIDSGPSFHITPSRECFLSYTVGDYGSVKMGDNGACNIAGIGSLCLTTSIGCILNLRDI